MDLYQITGDQFYLDAVDGFVDMFAEHFLHVGGTVAIKEWKVCCLVGRCRLDDHQAVPSKVVFFYHCTTPLL